jgi:hypothetical protein
MMSDFNIMDIPEYRCGLPGAQAIINMVCKNKAEDIFGVPNTRKINSRRLMSILFKGIYFYIKDTIVIMQLVFIGILFKVSFLVLGHRG